VAGDRHGGAPKGERVGRGFARRDPRVTRAAHTRACRRDNDNKKAPVGAPPTLRSGGHEAKGAKPGRRNAGAGTRWAVWHREICKCTRGRALSGHSRV